MSQRGQAMRSTSARTLGNASVRTRFGACVGLVKGSFPMSTLQALRCLTRRRFLQDPFLSELLGTQISERDYERIKYVWKHFGMNTIKDLLRWYNNLDVQPFVDALKSQRELFKRYQLDMLMDGISLPGLSEKIMYQICYSNLHITVQPPGKRSHLPSGG